MRLLPASFWRAVALFAWRRWVAKPVGARDMPDGVPNIRDRSNRCSAFAPRKATPGDFACEGDGHYLCPSCAHYEVAQEAQAVTGRKAP